MNTHSKSDVVIAGGGIVGLATAYQIANKYPQMTVTVLEKEAEVGVHQTGSNSGVIHSGIYYKPGSLKALNCREGRSMMERFCKDEGIAYDICGKVIVAVNDSEVERLMHIYERGQKNGVRCEVIDRERLCEIEPHTAGVKAIWVPDAGIVSYRDVALRLAEILAQRGGRVINDAFVKGIKKSGDEVVVQSTAGDFHGSYMINCTGLFCDRIAKKTGERPESKVVPFRGEYYDLKPESYHLCNNLIYPVPDPQFPFLGVHFTRMIDGRFECGPNAVLAFAREGYRKRDVNFRDLFEALSYKGFRKMASRHWKMGMGEMWRSFSKKAFVKALQRLVPSVTEDDLIRGRAGVRAQLLGTDGSLIDDFIILSSPRVINVCNAPSPAATSSLKIGKTIVEHLSEQVDR
ncbi:MAG: L-2-hydroxyglutarate oxidase [Pirellulaceae bacterium]|nr:L-2-hydroxyglutarate oxidase [Rhodopirellula sp.]MCH2600313.1 L-2-hydroxyglutarate oxidase [Pirellulales bacterium]